ncbi:MAG: acyl-CoA thioesterase [Victivallaceae bacterium]|nr:acyl-CoA thioesterase [Victivallaceae bacterium]
MRRRKKKYFECETDAPAAIEVAITRRLQFSEVDALAIAWHGRYMTFFEEAANELGQMIGLTYAAYRDAGVGAPIAQIHVDYHQPLLLDQKFTVTAALIWSEAARLNTEYRIVNELNECVATGYTIQMFYDLTNREPFWLTPDLVQEMKKRWENGEFNG